MRSAHELQLNGQCQKGSFVLSLLVVASFQHFRLAIVEDTMFHCEQLARFLSKQSK
jgi:hypothetical protein